MGIAAQCVQQRIHAGKAQRRAKTAGEQLALRNDPGDIVVRKRIRFQIARKQRFVARGGLLAQNFVGAFHAVRAQRAAQLRQKRFAVCAGQIHFIDEQKYGNASALEQLPNRAGVALYAVGTADHKNGEIQHLKRALHLAGKIHMAGRIQQCEGNAGQLQHRLLGKYRDAAFALLRVVIQKRVLMIDPPQTPQRAAGVEHRLRKRRFACVHMRQKACAQLFFRFAFRDGLHCVISSAVA